VAGEGINKPAFQCNNPLGFYVGQREEGKKKKGPKTICGSTATAWTIFPLIFFGAEKGEEGGKEKEA